MHGQDSAGELREIYAWERYGGGGAGGKPDERRARELLRAVAKIAARAPDA